MPPLFILQRPSRTDKKRVAGAEPRRRTAAEEEEEEEKFFFSPSSSTFNSSTAERKENKQMTGSLRSAPCKVFVFKRT